MKWLFPAKTFLLGEYVALHGGPAILLTTSPCFEMSLIQEPLLEGIHPHSPAGKWWQKQKITGGLRWTDPYQGLGGVGASSAQFLGAYWAVLYEKKQAFDVSEMLEAYYECAWSKKGICPSGYDVIAQSAEGCVVINKKKNRLNRHSGYYKVSEEWQERAVFQHEAVRIMKNKLSLIESQDVGFCRDGVEGRKSDRDYYDWPFTEISFILIHTHHKVATHLHLEKCNDLQGVARLDAIAYQGQIAFEQQDAMKLIQAINAYQTQLTHQGLMAKNSCDQIDKLSAFPDILAAKGCGALGSDTLLLIVPSNKKQALQVTLSQKGFHVLATESSLFSRAK